MYNWEQSKSKSKSKHKGTHEYDSKNPTFSSSFLNKFNKSHKTHHPKTSQIVVSDRLTASSNTHLDEDFFKTTTVTTKSRGSTTTTTSTLLEDEKMSSLRRACLVEKWMEKKVSDKVVITPGEVKSSSRSSSSTTLLEEFDMHDALFFSSTTTTTTSSSSSPSEAEYSAFSHPKQKPRVTCFAPPRPKPIKTRNIESKYLEQLGQERKMKNNAKALNLYSNLKNLKQPISPGIRLTSFINSLFAKDGKNSKKKCNIIEEQEPTSTVHSSCSSASSFARSCLSKNRKLHEEGIKRSVRFCPVSVILDDDSQPCGYKTLREEKGDRLLNTKHGRSLSKRYEELRKLKGLEKESDKFEQQKKLEEVALDLLSGYWDARLNKSHDLSSKDKVSVLNEGDYGDNHGVNYVQNEAVDDDDDGFSCSSSDLFELDHLSLIGNELPVYETTQFDT